MMTQIHYMWQAIQNLLYLLIGKVLLKPKRLFVWVRPMPMGLLFGQVKL